MPSMKGKREKKLPLKTFRFVVGIFIVSIISHHNKKAALPFGPRRSASTVPENKSNPIRILLMPILFIIILYKYI